MFSSLVSYSAEVYETASEDFMNAVKTLVISEAKNSKNLKAYIEKGVEEKNLVFSVKIEKEKMIVKDKTGKLLHEKVLSKNVSNSFLPFEMKYQEIHKKEGAFEYADITYLEDNEKFRIKYESKIKKTSAKTKNSDFVEVSLEDVEYKTLDLYDKNGKLLTKQEDIGNKTIVTNYLDEGHKLKIIYNFDSNLTTGNIETWLDKTLLSKGKMKDGLPHGEMKIFNEKGKVISIINYNSIFSYSSIKAVNEKELQKVFNKNKEMIVVYRASIKDNIPKKYIENIIPKEEFNISNDNRIKNTIRYVQKNKLDILAEVYTPSGDLAVKTEIKLRKEILFSEIEKLVQEIEDNEGNNQSDILNNKFSENFEENVKSFISYSYYDDGSLSSKTEYDFDKKNITMLTYSEGKISSESIAKYKGSIQDENIDIDFYENLSKTYTKMKVKKVENGQEVRTFYPNGKLKSVGVYKDNILNGDYKEYDENGKLIKEIKNNDFLGE